MLDEICEQLSQGTRIGEWTSLDELSDITRRYSLDEKDAEEIVDFLKKYFLEVDESGSKARLRSWWYPLFQVS